MFSLNFVLRLLTLVLFVLRQGYWVVTEKIADRNKPKKSFRFQFKIKLVRIAYDGLVIFLMIQLLGVNIFPIHHNTFVQIVGFIIGAGSVVISILGRHELGVNWTHAAEYQIKNNHELIVSGIYKYARHPIYLGIFLSFVGAELVAESYLVIFFFFLCLFGTYYQSKKEEVILQKHFGKEYERYMNNTKMLIPYIF